MLIWHFQCTEKSAHGQESTLEQSERWTPKTGNCDQILYQNITTQAQPSGDFDISRYRRRYGPRSHSIDKYPRPATKKSMVRAWCVRLPRPAGIGRGATEALGQLGQALRGGHGAGGGHAQLDCHRICRLALVAITSRLPARGTSDGIAICRSATGKTRHTGPAYRDPSGNPVPPRIRGPRLPRPATTPVLLLPPPSHPWPKDRPR